MLIPMPGPNSMREFRNPKRAKQRVDFTTNGSLSWKIDEDTLE